MHSTVDHSRKRVRAELVNRFDGIDVSVSGFKMEPQPAQSGLR